MQSRVSWRGRERGKRKVERRCHPALLGVGDDDAQKTVEIPRYERILGTPVELCGVVDDALVTVDDLELNCAARSQPRRR